MSGERANNKQKSFVKTICEIKNQHIETEQMGFETELHSENNKLSELL